MTFTLYDSVTPENIPNGANAAVYVNGRFFARPDQVRRFKSVYWIDVNGTDPFAQCLDVETGDADASQIPEWVTRHVDHYGLGNPRVKARLYGNLIGNPPHNGWQSMRNQVATLPPEYRAHVVYWIANPTGVPHIVPGSAGTQYKWTSKVDISLCNYQWI